MTLAGRTALVTGASGRGMGRSIALTLAREGADIVINYKERRERAEEMAQVIESLGRRALVHQADVSDADAVQEMVQAESHFGQVDIVIGSAGGSWQPRDLPEIEPEHWRAVMAEEVDATYALLRAALPGMRQRRWGRIVLIGGYQADEWRFDPTDAPLDYALGKAARHWLARTLGPRERANGVTINAVAPGPIEYITLERARELAEQGPPPGGESTPQDIAELVAFLCSERARAITGAVIPLPGIREV
ncbi:MAG: SDR family oxidoreductase [Chloroflexi bacterium]|nr:SDR family oxidoreductase [Chloroflexota bacterium]